MKSRDTRTLYEGMTRIWLRLKMLWRRAQLDRDLEDELAFHLSMREQKYISAGLSYHEAYYLARRRFGSPTSLKERCREMWRFVSIETFWQDIRYGARLLWRSPGFTAVAAITLALGIGANTAIFTLINAVMLNSLPVEHPNELVLFSDDPSEGDISGGPPGLWWELSYPSYEYFRDHNQVFSGLAAVQYSRFRISARVPGASAVEMTRGQLVSGNYFSVLGIKGFAGRTLSPDDDRPGAVPAAVLSYAYWQRRFGNDRSIVGKTVELNDMQVGVVGIAPREFFGVTVGGQPDYWLPLSLQPQITLLGKSYLDDNEEFWLDLIGRLKPGVTIQKAEAEMNVELHQFVSDRLASKFPSATREKDIEKQHVALVPGGKGISVLRLRYSDLFRMLMGLVLLVLLIACVNVANMLLARAMAREKEIGMRMALGAGRWRLIRQLLTEGLLIAAIGGALGLLAAHWGVQLLVSMVNLKGFPLRLDPDARVLLFTFACCLLTGLLFGLAPALRATRKELVPALTGAAAARRFSRFGIGRLLVIGQVAMSLLLVVSAGLFARSLVNLQNQDLGFNREHVLLVGFDPRIAGYKEAQLPALYRQILDGSSVLPEVKSATLAYYSPLSGSASTRNMTIVGYTPQPGEHMDFECVAVGPRYFETLGIPLLSGRGIEPKDLDAKNMVAVINETAARNYFPKENPIGRKMYFGSVSPGSTKIPPLIEIVGVAKDTVFGDLRKRPMNMIFTPVIEGGTKASFGDELEIRTIGDPRSITKSVREALAQIDPHLPVTRVSTLDGNIRDASSEARTIAQLAALLAALALILAPIGIYGVMAHGVQRKTKEIGIRVALGAQRWSLLWMIMKETVIVAGIGVAIGAPASIAVARLTKSALFGVGQMDPLTISASVLVMFFAAVLAGYLPARRATRIDPIKALRYE